MTGEFSGATAVILCGGQGLRLRGVIGDHTPKALAPIKNRPFLLYLLDQLVEGGARRIILCTGWRGARIRAAVGNKYKGVPIIYSHESHPRGTGGALKLIEPLLDPPQHPFILLNGDTYVQAGLGDLWRRASALPAGKIVMGLGTEMGVVRQVVDRNSFNMVIRVGPARPNDLIHTVGNGIYVIHRSVVEAIPDDREVSFEQQVLPSWINFGLFGFVVGQKWIDIGTPASYSTAQTFFNPPSLIELP